MSPPPYLTAPRPNPRQQPAAALRALAAYLRAAGITQLYGSACALFGVLSVASGLTVWTNGRLLWWQTGGNQQTWPATDPQGAARASPPSHPPQPTTAPRRTLTRSPAGLVAGHRRPMAPHRVRGHRHPLTPAPRGAG